MTTQTTTLTDFLLARLAEDEAAANTAHRESMRGHAGPGFARSRVAWAAQAEGVRGYDLIERMTPARVLAEVEAKRRIVNRFAWAHDIGGTEEQATMIDLASAYADHPDYNESWRP